MSIGNLKDYGNKGNNFPWQLKMLVGQQCACDSLKDISINTTNLDPLLNQILAAIQNGTDYEAVLVVDSNDTTWLEIRIWNGTTFDPPIYFAAGSNTPGTPVGTITYINPNTYLAQIVSYTSNLVSIEAGTPDALGQTTMSASMPVTIASDQTPLPVNINTPIGQQSITSSVAVALASEQANVQIIPMVIEATGTAGDLTAYAGSQLLSISFASRGTAPVDLSVDGNNTLFRLLPGETLTMDANGVINYYDPTLFYWDATAAGAAVLIAFNYI